MPELEISQDQIKNVRRWIESQDGNQIEDNFHESEDYDYDEPESLDREIWMVKDEPLVMYKHTSPIFVKIGKRVLVGSERFYVLCSNEHVRELRSLVQIVQTQRL